MSALAQSCGAPRSTWIAVAVIVLLALGAAGRGMGDIPLDSHEIYVAQTAENMLASGDWLVPRLNGEYRLTKPPLSYWVVAGAATLAGQSEVSPAIARLPSVIAVAGVALLALWIGARLFDRRTGILAAFMCVASLAAFKYGHNARPDMLYTLCTTAVLATWVGSRQALVKQRALWIWALWVVFGLATLTKGPQAPLILLAGLVLHATLAGDRTREILRQLRPLRGVLIVLIMVVPWYLLLRRAIGGQPLGDSQLSGELLTLDPLRLFTPFYVVHSPLLWLPWALLLPAAVVCVWRDPRGPTGMLAFTLVLAMLCFSLGPQYRQIYMLPWLVPAMIVFATALMRVAWARFVLGLILAAVAVAFGWLVYADGTATLASAAAGVLLIVGAVRAMRHRRTPAAAMLVAAALALGLFQGGAVTSLWSKSRYQELAFVHALSRQMKPNMPVVVWDIDPAPYSYYLGRPVSGDESLSAICDWLGHQDTDALLIYPEDRHRELAQNLVVVPFLSDNDSPFAATRVQRGANCRPQPKVGA